jgi:hypothetical protein
MRGLYRFLLRAVIPKTYSPPLLGGASGLPPDLYQVSLANALAQRPLLPAASALALAPSSIIFNYTPHGSAIPLLPFRHQYSKRRCVCDNAGVRLQLAQFRPRWRRYASRRSIRGFEYCRSGRPRTKQL